ncbi:MAG: 4Fe-4S binding protein [Candidatus Omnitrophica bacterium]|nr:4Fe-4S binding protein [Candidatus Omnitrophota bacterium]MBU2474314.1 4Fe-4S binding protein [Candidatus Omnitrophota bacterium]
MVKTHKIVIDHDKCKGCQLCIFYCPVKHLKLTRQLNKRGVRFAETGPKTKCNGCGFCFQICPETCIEIYESSK